MKTNPHCSNILFFTFVSRSLLACEQARSFRSPYSSNLLSPSSTHFARYVFAVLDGSLFAGSSLYFGTVL